MNHLEYMKFALGLAKKGYGFVNPNPMVGAVIVKDDKIIGQGYHEKYGELHAERNALANCKISPKDATMYVTLEPCCHYGKTPPCTEAIIRSGIQRVVIGSNDPNPLVKGKGIAELRKHGIVVEAGVLKEECDKLNEVFFHFIENKTPFVLMKYAMTLDGKIATVAGKSKWITGEEARNNVHEDRHRYSAIMVGIGTVLSDNPLLTCRIENRRNPIRVICDTNLRMPLDCNIVNTAKEIPTIIATCSTEIQRYLQYMDLGCKIIVVNKKENHLDLKELMIKLGEENIDSIFLEGGASLNWSMLQYGLINKVQAYIAPKLFGGEGAKSPIGGMGIENPEDAFYLENHKMTQLGDDLLIESEVKVKCLQESLKK